MDQKTIASLLGTSRRNVTKHLNNKFESGELSEEENKVNPQLANDFGKLKINTITDNQPFLYNLMLLWLLCIVLIQNKLLTFINGQIKSLKKYFNE